MTTLDNYELLIGLISAKDFAHLIYGEIDINELVSPKYRKFMKYCEEQWDSENFIDERDYVFLVTKSRDAVGFALPEHPLAVKGETGKEQMFPITPTLMISGDTSLLELVGIFAKEELWDEWAKNAGIAREEGKGCPLSNRYLFVLSGNHITHVIRYKDLLSLPLRIIVFSLVLSLESRILDVLKHSAKKAVSHLPPKRLEKARQTCKFRNLTQKGKDYQSDDILESTTFIDRCEMLLELDEFTKLPFTSKVTARRFFKHIENLRNDVAHSRQSEEISESPSTLYGILETLTGCLESFVELESR